MSASRRGRVLKGLGLGLLALLLTLLFVLLRFPTDALGRSIAAQLEARSGVRIQFGSIARRPLGLKAENVLVTLPPGQQVRVDSLRIRPACSARWLLGEPVFWVDVDADDRGDIEGELNLGRRRAFDGELRDVDLAALPTEQIVSGLRLTGRIDGTIQLTLVPGEPSEGEVSFKARQGTVTAPNLPLPLPFETFDGELTLGGEHYATVHALTVRGPQLDGDVSGTVAHAAGSGAQPLDLALTLRARGPQLRSFLQQLGVPLARDGRAELQLVGTLAQPTFR